MLLLGSLQIQCQQLKDKAVHEALFISKRAFFWFFDLEKYKTDVKMQPEKLQFHVFFLNNEKRSVKYA